MIQGDYTHETREYGRAFIQNLQARIRELEENITALIDDQHNAEARQARTERARDQLQYLLDRMCEAYDAASQGRAQDWREHEAAEAETLDDLGHLRMRIMRLERAAHPRVMIAASGTDPETGEGWTEIGHLIEPITFTAHASDVDPAVVDMFYTGVDLDNPK